MNKDLIQIDYSCLVRSQVLMEFWDYEIEDGFTGFLTYINPTIEHYRSHTDDGWLHCRIYQHHDYWISNAKGDLVLPIGLMVKSKTRDGRSYNPVHIADAGNVGLELKHIFGGGDIISVQVTEPAEGYKE